MKTSLTEQIQAVIIATQDCKKFLTSYHYSVLKDMYFDWWEETQKFYNNLPLPEGMEKNNCCFEAVIRYPIREIINTEMEDLPKKFTFGY